MAKLPKTMVLRLFILWTSFTFFVGCSTELPNPSGPLSIKSMDKLTKLSKAIVLPNQQYGIAGVKDGAPALLIVDHDLNVVMEKRFEEYGYGVFNDVILAKNGDLVATGYTISKEIGSSQDDPYGLAVRIKPDGTVLWTYTRDYMYTTYNQWHGLTEKRDGSIVLAGEVSQPNGRHASWLVRLTERGQAIDSATHMYSTHTRATSVCEGTDGNLAFINFISSTATGSNILLTNHADGAIVNSSIDKYSLPEPYTLYHVDLKSALLPYQDGSLAAMQFYNDTYLVGQDIRLVRFDQNFNIVWDKHIEGEGYAEFRNLQVVGDQLLISGDTYLDLTGRERKAYVVLVNPDGSIEWENKLGSAQRYHSALVCTANDNSIHVLGASSGDDGADLIHYTLSKKGEVLLH